MKDYKIVLEGLQLAERHRCERCIFCYEIPDEPTGDEGCNEPSELDCKLRGHWVLEELE